MKTKIKELARETLLRTGLWRRYLERMAQRGEAIILTYHRVIEKWDRTLDYSQPGMVVTADTFDRQLTFLKQHFNIVSLSDLVNSKFEIRNSKLACPLCAITFDDGWRDNYEIALPIFRKHEVPATIFVTTDFIGSDRSFWHTRLMYVLLHGDLSNDTGIRGIVPGYPGDVRHYLMGLATMARTPSVEELDSLVEAVKASCDEAGIEELIRDLTYIGGIRRPFLSDRRFFLEWDQVRAMGADGIEIGSHGCSHRILTRLTADEVGDELIRSKAEIEQRIGRTVDHFAFPEGAANRSLIEAAANVGFKVACLSGSRPDEARFSSVALPRVGMHEGVSTGGNGAFSEASLSLWLLRAPKFRAI